MSKENKENKKVLVIESKRKDYIFLVEFFKEIKEKNILVVESNKDLIREIYFKYSNNKVFSNIERVLRRSLRVEIKENLIKDLEKNNLSLNEYLEFKNKVILVSREYKKSKFLNVSLKI